MKTIIRIEKSRDFSIINNTGLRDTILSWKAKGLLAYLLSLPDDWQIYVEELSNHSRDGIDRTSSAIKELSQNGYILRERLRNEKGQLKNYLYIVYEVPQTVDISHVEPKRENPVLGNPILENPRLLSTKLLNTNINLEEEETTQGVDVEQEIIKTYKDCISSKISNREFKILADLQETIGKELLKKAIILAVMKNGKNLGYIQAVIKDWNKKGFTTLEQVNTYLLEWLSMNKKAKENRTKQIKKKAENKNYPKKESLFNDYEQREYDFDDLEKKLLRWESD